jgi:peptidyl-prolyl cis-trans isomerase SurA
MKKAFFAILLLCLGGLNVLFAQAPDPVLMTVAGEKVTSSEFLNVYMKNNVKGDAMDRKSLEEYLDLYINFKLKVKEAEELGLDTATSFKNELGGYRKQLAQPYLTDKTIEDALLKEAWERSAYDLRASHILIKLDKNAPPADTLAAYKKIMAIRARILKGEDFAKVAAEVSEDEQARDREDPQTKRMLKGNGGDLGYFTVLDMVYPFENAVYKMKPGEISMPVRTDNGYHIIKLTQKNPALGKITVAHIFVNVPKDITDENIKAYKDRIDEAYAHLQRGDKWEDVVSTYSDDKGSAAKGGQLPAFGVNQIVPEFVDAILTIKNIGDYSQPVRTSYGFHIIKLIDKKVPKTFEEDKAAIKNRLIRDKRMSLSRESVINRVKKENNFTENKGVISDFYTVVDTTVYAGNWDMKKASALTKPLFSIGGTVYSEQDFAKWLSTHQQKKVKTSMPIYVNEKYNQYLEESILALEDSKLESKYPEFKQLMKEYRDGILLFELTDQKVWSRAIKDSVGLEAFYEKNKNNYLWEERLDASIYTCKDEKTAAAARKLAKVQEKKGYTDQDILKKINLDSIAVLKINSKYFLHKENSVIDHIAWQKGITDNQTADNSVIFVVVRGVVPPTPKTIREAKGIITADYQNYLEKQWIDELRAKYKVDVDRNVFESLIKK